MHLEAEQRICSVLSPAVNALYTDQIQNINAQKHKYYKPTRLCEKQNGFCDYVWETSVEQLNLRGNSCFHR